MAKLNNEYIQGRIAGNAKVSEAYMDDAGNAVIVAAKGYGWDCGDMPPAEVDIIPAGAGVKHFNLSLDRIKPIAVIEAAPVQAEDEFDDADGDYDAPEETEEDAEDDNA